MTSHLGSADRHPAAESFARGYHVAVGVGAACLLLAALVAVIEFRRRTFRAASPRTPERRIATAVVQAIAELGLDLTKEFPKPLTTDVVQGADVVITMGCGDACPIFPGKRYLDWELGDARRPRPRRCATHPRRRRPTSPSTRRQPAQLVTNLSGPRVQPD